MQTQRDVLAVAALAIVGFVTGSVLTGCQVTGPSVSPFYTMKAIEKQPTLVGTWTLVHGPDGNESGRAVCEIEIVEQSFGYGMTFLEPEKAEWDGERYPNMFFVVFRAGEHRYVDMRLGWEEWEKVLEIAGRFVVPTHYMLKLEGDADEFVLIGPAQLGTQKLTPLGMLLDEGRLSEFQTVNAMEGHTELFDGMLAEQEEARKQEFEEAAKMMRVDIITASSPQLANSIAEAEKSGYFSEKILILRRSEPAGEVPAE